MPSFSRDGLNLAYHVHGQGRPVLLIHGITVSFQRNFMNPGWVTALNEAGCKVIGLDMRGHGMSDKPSSKEAYGTAKLAEDALALLDHLEIKRAGVFGYSLGSAVALELLVRNPDRFDAAALGGTGDGLIGESPLTMNYVASRLRIALARERFPDDLPQHESIYWTFATTGDGDRQACLAAAEASYDAQSLERLKACGQPVLVVSGSADLVLGTGPQLAAAFPHGQYLEVPEANHFTLNRHPDAHHAVAGFFAS